MEFLSLLQRYGLSHAIFGISFSSPKIWTIICNINNFYPFPKNVNYHMQFWKFLSLVNKHELSHASIKNSFLLSKNIDYHMEFLDFLSLFKKHGLSYAIFRSYYSFSKNMDYHIQFLEFLSLL